VNVGHSPPLDIAPPDSPPNNFSPHRGHFSRLIKQNWTIPSNRYADPNRSTSINFIYIFIYHNMIESTEQKEQQKSAILYTLTVDSIKLQIGGWWWWKGQCPTPYKRGNCSGGPFRGNGKGEMSGSMQVLIILLCRDSGNNPSSSSSPTRCSSVVFDSSS